MLLFVLGSSKLVPTVHHFFAQFKSSFAIYNGGGGKPLTVDWLLTPGTLIMLSAILGGLLQDASPKKLRTIGFDTLSQLQKTGVTVLSIVSMAKVLGYSFSGNDRSLLSAGSTLYWRVRNLYYWQRYQLKCLIWAYAERCSHTTRSRPCLAGRCQYSGASAGKLISPQSIAIVAAATGLSGKEGDLLNVTIKYVCYFVAALGVITLLFAF